jgi:3-phenylpropionate/cinnamic acid dioxygenase small subunit
VSLMTHDIRGSVERFLIRESALLDDSKLADWQQLFALDGTYWMPLDPAQPDAVNHVSLIYDDRTLMDLRCRRLGDADDASLSLHPYPKSLRFLSNVEVSGIANGELEARANLMAVQHAAGSTQQYFARVRWTLSGTAPGYLIRQKRVDLLTAGAPLRDILVYL